VHPAARNAPETTVIPPDLFDVSPISASA
jgi:hypothetical protein